MPKYELDLKQLKKHDELKGLRTRDRQKIRQFYQAHSVNRAYHVKDMAGVSRTLTPLAISVLLSKDDAFAVLVRHPQLKMSQHQGQALFIAAETGQLAKLKIMVNKQKFFNASLHANLQQLLQLASDKGHQDVVHYLLSLAPMSVKEQFADVDRVPVPPTPAKPSVQDSETDALVNAPLEPSAQESHADAIQADIPSLERALADSNMPLFIELASSLQVLKQLQRNVAQSDDNILTKNKGQIISYLKQLKTEHEASQPGTPFALSRPMDRLSPLLYQAIFKSDNSDIDFLISISPKLKGSVVQSDLLNFVDNLIKDMVKGEHRYFKASPSSAKMLKLYEIRNQLLLSILKEGQVKPEVELMATKDIADLCQAPRNFLSAIPGLRFFVSTAPQSLSDLQGYLDKHPQVKEMLETLQSEQDGVSDSPNV